MRTICALIGAIVVVVSTSSAQQNRFHIVADVNLTLVNATKGIHKFSSPGWGVGVGIARDLNPFAQVVMEGSYQKVPFERGSANEVFPNAAALGFVIVGEPSSAYRINIQVRVAFLRNGIRPFVMIGGGLMFHKSGFVGYADQTTPQTPYWNYPLRGNDAVTMGFIFTGIGMEVPLTEKVLASVAVSLSTPFTGQSVAFPITLRWSFQL